MYRAVLIAYFRFWFDRGDPALANSGQSYFKTDAMNHFKRRRKRVGGLYLVSVMDVLCLANVV